MRLIDADAVRQKREDFAITSNAEMNRFSRMFVDLFNREIDKAPTIDAVEVVRCKDCSNRDTDTCPAYQSIFGDMYDDDYCSFGERKEVRDGTD